MCEPHRITNDKFCAQLSISNTHLTLYEGPKTKHCFSFIGHDSERCPLTVLFGNNSEFISVLHANKIKSQLLHEQTFQNRFKIADEQKIYDINIHLC